MVVSLYYLTQLSYTCWNFVCDFLHLKVSFSIKIHFVFSSIEDFHSASLSSCGMRKGMHKQHSIHRDQQYLNRVLICWALQQNILLPCHFFLWWELKTVWNITRKLWPLCLLLYRPWFLGYEALILLGLLVPQKVTWDFKLSLREWIQIARSYVGRP